MKSILPWFTVLPIGVLTLGACKKEEVKQPGSETPGQSAAAVPGTPAVPEVKGLTAGERAAMLGIVGRLSKDTESVLALYDGKGMVSGLKSLKTWQFAREIIREEEGMDPEEQIAAGAMEAGRFLGQEIFLATGKGTAPQLENLIKLNQRSNYYQMRIMVQSFADGLKSGDLSGLESSNQTALMAMAKELGKEMAVIESAAMPPVLVGVKAVDAEALQQAQQQITSSLEAIPSMLGEAATPLEFTKGGVTFKGYKLAGTFLAEQMEGGRQDMEQIFEPGDVDRLLAAVKTKNLVIAVGAVDNYLMLFTGDNEEACPLVESVDESLAGNPAISFVDAWKDKKVSGFLYGEENLVKAGVAGSLKDLALGVRDGLTGVEEFGDTRELASLLELVGEKEDSLMELVSSKAVGGLIVLDEGVKFELFGGNDYGAIDHDAAHKLANLPTEGETLLFANWVSDAEHSKRANEYVEAIVETAYSFAEKIASLDAGESADLAQFQQGFALFNDKFRADTVGLWNAISTSEQGLGTEGAFVVDLKGAMPPLPGLPQEIVDGGKFVRASLVSPVTDRAKLQESWTGIDTSLKNLLKTASEMTGQDIPMQKPISSEKDGFSTWFFTLPFTNEDFLPSVTVGDKWFVASTSKNQSQELAIAADKAAGDRTGAWFDLDFDVLRKFTSDWLDLIEKNGETTMGGPEAFEEFKAQLPRIKKGLAAAEEFDGLTVHERVENGTLRTSLHVKLR